MKSKKILILALIITSTVALLGCSNSNSKEISSKESSLTENNTSDKDSNSPETAKKEESKTNTDKTATASSDEKSTNSSKNTNSNNNTANSSSRNTNSNNTKQENTTSLNYKSKLGFSLTFPSNWKKRYKIKEDDKSMYVYFKSTDPNTPDNLGLLFFIKKNYTQEDEDMSDSVLPNGQRHITVGNTTYLVGGPTDVNLNEDNKDFQLFLSLHKECEKVINTITP